MQSDYQQWIMGKTPFSTLQLCSGFVCIKDSVPSLPLHYFINLKPLSKFVSPI